MTSLLRLTGLTAISLSAGLSMTAGLALAGDDKVSADQIVHALTPKPLTRSRSAEPQADPALKAKEIGFIQTLRNRKTRSLSTGEREEIAQIASTKPKIDLDIQFDYNSAEIRASRCRTCRPSARRSRIPNSTGRPSSSPATPTPSAANPSTRISPNAAPTLSSAI